MSDGRIIIDTEIDSSGVEKDIKGLNSKIGSLAKTGLSVFTGTIATAGAAIGGLAAVATKYNSQMEDYFANFTVLLGSAEKATKHVEDLKKFAAKTPFEMTGLADASKQLLSFGIGVDDVMPDLQMLGDISLGNQERFKGLALVFAQVASAGKLTGQDLLQFINQGFNPLQVIAEKTGKSMAELKEEMADGKISYEMVAEAMKVATSEGGKFYQGMEVQSKTLSGMWSTLKDDTMSLIGGAFTPFSDVLKNEVMPALQDMVKHMAQAFADPNIQNSIANIASGLGDLAVKAGELISEWLPKIIEGFAWMLDNSNEIAAGVIGIGVALLTLNVANMIMGVVKAFQAAKLAEEGLTVAQWLLNVAMNANPVGIIIALVAGLVAAFIYLWNTNDGFREAIISCWNAIKDVGIAVWEWLVKFFTEDIPLAWQAVVDFFSGIPAWFAELWAKVTDKFKEWGTNISNFFTETIPMWIESIFNWFISLPEKIGFALGYALGTIIKWGLDTWNYIITNVPIWIECVVNYFSELPGKILNWLVNAYHNIVNWGSDTISNMGDTASNAIDAVINYFSTLPSRLANWLCSTIAKVAEFGSDMWNKAKEIGSTFGENILDSIKSLPSRFMEIGKNIVRGVWDGIIGMGRWIADKVSGFFSGIVDGAKSALGIHSPSKVFRDQVGKYMAQGVGVGFEEEGKRSVMTKMNDTFANIVGEMQTAVSQSQSGMKSLAMAGVSNNYTTNYYSNDNKDIKTESRQIIEVPVNFDGREVARVLAPYQNEFTEYGKGR